jgi:LacI family transcriptional regulator, galactose operon repressor
VKTAGLDPYRTIVDITTHAQSAREGEECVEQLLSASPVPTAVFCANDLLALGLMRGLIKRGISIPRDMALVGYDDVEFASVLSVPLTSIRQPKYELGRAAAGLLLDEANNPASHQHKHVMYQPELIVRESSLM